MIPEAEPPDEAVRRFLDEQMRDPQFRAVYEDTQERRRIMEALVERRKTAGLTQQDIADRLTIGQNRISMIERKGADLRLSTMQRYARALNTRIRLTLTPDDDTP